MNNENKSRSDRKEIERAIEVLFQEDAFIELRIINAHNGEKFLKTVSGYFDGEHRDLLIKIAMKYSGHSPAVYVTLNPVDPDVSARSLNRMTPFAKTTTGDKEIDRRFWLPLDFDSKRPKGISATDAERQAALDRAKEVQKFLKEKGFPEPVFADSGNGAHLLYRIDLPNDKESTKLLKEFLKSLDSEWSDKKVSVDRSVFNPSRIWKLYGTMAAKGDSVQDRPHRIARIISVPDELIVVTAEQIRSIIKVKKRSRFSHNDFDLLAWLNKHDVKFTKEKEWEGGTLYELENCPFRPDEKDGGAWIAQAGDGSLAAGCHHNSCLDKKWTDFRDHFDPDGTDSGKKPSQTERLLKFAEECELIRTSDGKAFVKFSVRKHSETWPVKSENFEQWLRMRFYEDEKSVPRKDALTNVIATVEMLALHQEIITETFVRVGHHEGKVYLDLCDAEWRVVEIDQEGWRIISSPAIIFRRSNGMRSLPEPTQEGSLEPLKSMLNINDEDWSLVVGWLVGALSPHGPYPVLLLNAEQGAAKSTTAKLLRRLIDPSEVPLRGIPSSEQDLMISAHNSWCLIFDNLSVISGKYADAFCRLSTGGGFVTRELYSNTDEVLIDAKRPMILTSIADIATQSDLLDRCLILQLPTITEEKRRTESSIDKEFEACEPGLLGGLCDALSCSLANIDNIKLTKLSRMADFVGMVAAAEESLGFIPGTFLEAYERNRGSAVEIALEASSVYKALCEFIKPEAEPYEGTATELLKELLIYSLSGSDKWKFENWPKSAGQLSSILRQLSPNLRKKGFSIDNHQTSGSGSSKVWIISRKGVIESSS